MKHSNLKLGLGSMLLCLSVCTFALTNDQKQPIHIVAKEQHLDMKSNKMTFIGDVRLSQGSINIAAETVIAFRNATSGIIEKIEGFGTPATFTQQSDDGKTLHGEANEFYYHTQNEKIIMINNALLRQDDSEIRGNKIQYHISTLTLIADGQKAGDRVSTVIQPQATQEPVTQE